MKKLILILFLAVGIISAQEKPLAREIFIMKKCNHCHTNQKAQIFGAKMMGAKVVHPLDSLGFPDVNDLKLFLMQDSSFKRNQLHPVKFNGSDGELMDVVMWLIDMQSLEK